MVFDVEYYIFYISALDVGKWCLSGLRGRLSCIHQTVEMIVTEGTYDTL
jgi:hypothetical protein